MIRKSIVERFWKLGFSSLLADRKGEQLSSGGDSEYCKWLLMAGYKLWYDENLAFQHYIPSERLTIPYFKKLQEGHDQSFKVLKKYDLVLLAQQTTYITQVKNFFVCTIGLLKDLIFLNSKGVKNKLLGISLYSPLEYVSFDRDIRKIRSMQKVAKKNRAPR